MFKAGYGMYFDTLNAADYTQNSTGYSSTTTNTNSTDFGQTFTLGNPYTGVLANADPFPLRGGVRFIEPVDDTLGADTTSGTAQTLRFNLKHARQQRWRVALQREVFKNTSVEVSYDWIYSDRVPVDIREDYLPAEYWIPGSLNRATRRRRPRSTPTCPIRTTSPTCRRSQPAIRPCTTGSRRTASSPPPRSRAIACCARCSQYATGTGLVFGDQPLGEAKVHALQINGTRRFANGFTANVALAFTRFENTRTVEEYDREPTMWVLNNNSRPWRISGGAVYELPFGTASRG